MDRLIVSRKLDSLRRCLDRVRERCPASVATLAGDPDLQDIVVLNLSRAMQICVDLALHTLSSLEQPVPDIWDRHSINWPTLAISLPSWRCD